MQADINQQESKSIVREKFIQGVSIDHFLISKCLDFQQNIQQKQELVGQYYQLIQLNDSFSSSYFIAFLIASSEKDQQNAIILIEGILEECRNKMNQLFFAQHSTLDENFSNLDLELQQYSDQNLDNNHFFTLLVQNQLFKQTISYLFSTLATIKYNQKKIFNELQTFDASDFVLLCNQFNSQIVLTEIENNRIARVRTFDSEIKIKNQLSIPILKVYDKFYFGKKRSNFLKKPSFTYFKQVTGDESPEILQSVMLNSKNLPILGPVNCQVCQTNYYDQNNIYLYTNPRCGHISCFNCLQEFGMISKDINCIQQGCQNQITVSQYYELREQVEIYEITKEMNFADFKQEIQCKNCFRVGNLDIIVDQPLPEYFKCQNCKYLSCAIHEDKFEQCQCYKCPQCLISLVSSQDYYSCSKCPFKRPRLKIQFFSQCPICALCNGKMQFLSCCSAPIHVECNEGYLKGKAQECPRCRAPIYKLVENVINQETAYGKVYQSIYFKQKQ